MALKEIGSLLGYMSQCPDQEIRKGPDNLWCGEGNHFLLFECKSEVSEDCKTITKQETGQMNNHCGWFEDQYGKLTMVDRFMIIPTKDLSYEADFTHPVKIIKCQKLRDFKNSIKQFIKSIKPFDFVDIPDENLQHLLDLNKLNAKDFAINFS